MTEIHRASMIYNGRYSIFRRLMIKRERREIKFFGESNFCRFLRAIRSESQKLDDKDLGTSTKANLLESVIGVVAEVALSALY